MRFTDGKTIETPHKNLSGTIAMGEKVYFHGKMGCIIRVKLGFSRFSAFCFRTFSVNRSKDVSVYTVVFDDGDEKTLKRGSLCIKGKFQKFSEKKC